MIHISLSVEPHHRVRPAHVILAKSFETWDEVIEFLSPLNFNFMMPKDSDGTDIHLLLVDFKAENEYVGVEIELYDVTGTSCTDAVLSIEGNEVPRKSGGWPAVYILTTLSEISGRIIKQRLFEEPPKFKLGLNQQLRVGHVNGGDTLPTKPGR